jgi:CelD/BcsL family acetyltransferase involved in cellulose biosynthesis
MVATYRSIVCQELDSGLIRAWRDIQLMSPAFASAYFSPDFVQLVGSVRRDVRIVVVENNGRSVGFFPYQRSVLGLGKPVGGPLSDFHGVVASPNADWNLGSLLRAAQLKVWTFDHLIDEASKFCPYISGQSLSPQIDLSSGFQAYLESRRKAGSDYIPKTEALARKLAREHGDLRFSFNETSDEILEQLIKWKRDQYARTGIMDVFGFPWTNELVRRAASTQTTGFAGVCSVLRAGDQVVAAHLGMRTTDTLHYWFPAYDPAFSKFSPGITLLLRIAEAGASDGVRTIDLGAGDSQYKDRLMTSALVLKKGFVDTPSLIATARRLYMALDTSTSVGRLPTIFRFPVRAIRWVNRQQRFR